MRQGRRKGEACDDGSCGTAALGILQAGVSAGAASTVDGECCGPCG